MKKDRAKAGIFQVLSLSLILTGLFIIGYSYTYDSKVGADNTTKSEEQEIQKNRIIESIVIADSGLNKFQQDAKIAELSNLTLDKLKSLQNNGVKIYIVQNISHPDDAVAEIDKDNNIVTISLKAEKGVIIDAINNLNI